MTSITLTLRSGIPSFRRRTQLDGIEYVLAFRWSQRQARWYMDIAAADGTPIASSIQLVVQQPLIRQLRAIAAAPKGDMILVDRRPTPAAPTLANLGDFPLVYQGAA